MDSIHVFYECQDDLVDVLSVSIISILETCDIDVKVHLLDCGLCKLNKKIISSFFHDNYGCDIDFIMIDTSVFKKFPDWPKGSGNVDCYSRILIPTLCPNLSKALYLDSDVMAVDSIASLWNINIDNFFIGASYDLGFNKLYKNNIVKIGANINFKYINAGVLLFNCEQWRINKIYDKLYSLLLRYKNNILIPIEDVFSLFFSNEQIYHLPQRFNISDRENEIKYFFSDISDDYIRTEWNNAVLQHLSPGKSWKLLKLKYEARELKNFNLFWYFAHKSPFFTSLQQKYTYYSFSSLFNQIPSIFYKKCKNRIKSLFHKI